MSNTLQSLSSPRAATTHPDVLYHLYPLGQSGAPRQNPRQGQAVLRLKALQDWIPHWQKLGIGKVYLGPVFESHSHGYDTIDYRRVDRRLGDHQTLAELSQTMQTAGIQLVLDGVFHHVGRDFFAFADVLKKGADSAYRHWFELDFNQRSAFGDAFDYACWEGHHDLVKLNLNHPEVRDYLFTSISGWIQDFGIAGLRLDVAYALPKEFIRALATHCRALRPDFWLLGEVIHGDYSQFISAELLDSVTNYECYKGLWSSHNDKNYFEIAWSLNRLFGAEGLCKGQQLLNFADNHDVNRLASELHDPYHLYPLYLLLYTLPGQPALYYGSEMALTGLRSTQDDLALRPALSHQDLQSEHPLLQHLSRLASLRRRLPALQNGDYTQLAVSHQQLAFARHHQHSSCVILVNSAHQTEKIQLQQFLQPGHYHDLLNPGQSFDLSSGSKIEIDPCWGRILVKAEKL